MRCVAKKGDRQCLARTHGEDVPHYIAGPCGWVFFGIVRCTKCHRLVDAEKDKDCAAHDCDGAA